MCAANKTLATLLFAPHVPSTCPDQTVLGAPPLVKRRGSH